MISAGLNLIFLAFMNINVYAETNEFVTKTWINTIGAIATWCMWIKVFYWMRLFNFSAHYVTLITQIIDDVRVFMLMLIIVMTAFANFFYIINFNSGANPHNEYDSDFSYVP